MEPLPPVVTLENILQQAQLAASMLKEMRSGTFSPQNDKAAPVFRSEEVAQAAGITRNVLNHRISNNSALPQGSLNATGRKRTFTLAETQTLAREFRAGRLRPAQAEAVTIAVANFKGGTTKTTTAMTLAQGLTLLGHRVLAIDVDPQGSLTTLFGLLPDVEISEDETLLSVIDQENELYTVRPLIRQTYWANLDLIPAASSLFGAEFLLPALQQQHADFEFWNILNLALQDVRSDYDVIILDTPPSLSYLTINALMAANGIIMPLPPQMLDFASASQFWRLFADVSSAFERKAGTIKEFDFINILLTKVERRSSQEIASQWIMGTYADKVLPLEIPKTETAAQKSMTFGTVFDSFADEVKDRTYKRAREAYDQFVLRIDDQIQNAWKRQMLQTGASTAVATDANLGVSA